MNYLCGVNLGIGHALFLQYNIGTLPVRYHIITHVVISQGHIPIVI